MNFGKITNISLFATLVSIALISIQVYWNWNNFENTKKSFLNDTQVTIDNTVDKYFLDESKKIIKELIPIGFEKINLNVGKENNSENKPTEIRIEKLNIHEKPAYYNSGIDSENAEIAQTSIHKPSEHTTVIEQNSSSKKNKGIVIEKIEFFNDSMKNPLVIDTKKGKKIKLFGDSINYNLLVKKVNQSLKLKNLSNNYTLVYWEDKNIKNVYDNSTGGKISPKNFSPNSSTVIQSKSDYLENDSALKFYFENVNLIILKKIINTLLLSVILSFSIIWCLYYLLRTVKRHKQIAEMKNDFISNISHELKTPIAIVNSAIEGIQNFNTVNDKSKVDKYLEISKSELEKLNTIVERILENASQENSKLEVNKIRTNIFALAESSVRKYQLQTDKKITLTCNASEMYCEIDTFHIENCIGNLIENAIKYGGNKIEVALSKNSKSSIIEIKDNGDGIPKHLTNQIFDKFYRIPTQNIHNFKGFGIGLYYVRQMIEKHNGKITVNSQNGWVIFKIEIPNE